MSFFLIIGAMKKYLLLLLFFAVCLPISAKEKAEIRFASRIHDFGYVKETAGNVSHEFEFENTGDAPLIIISVRRSCGCTLPTYPKKPIAPGEKGKIGVTYIPTGRQGPFDKAVTVKTNAGNVHLRIKGNVIP